MASRRIRYRRNSIFVGWLFLAGLSAIVVAVCLAASSSARAPRTHVVSIPIKDIEIRPSIAPNGREPFQQTVERLEGATAIINGTYYDKNHKPLGDIVIDGKVANRGSQHAAIAVTNGGEVRFLRRGKERFDWRGYRAALAAGPRLVHNGKIALDPMADGFSKASLTKRANRSGVGMTKNRTLILVSSRRLLTLEEFAAIMHRLGAVEAINLDGGGACALYYNKQQLVTPVLPVTNVLALYPKSSGKSTAR